MKIFRKKDISTGQNADTIPGYCNFRAEMQMKRVCDSYQDNCFLSSILISAESLREQTAIFRGER